LGRKTEDSGAQFDGNRESMKTHVSKHTRVVNKFERSKGEERKAEAVHFVKALEQDGKRVIYIPIISISTLDDSLNKQPGSSYLCAEKWRERVMVRCRQKGFSDCA